MAEEEKKLEHSTYFTSFFRLTLARLTELQESAQDLYERTRRIFPSVEHEPFFDKAEQSLHEYVWMQKNLFNRTLGHYAAYLNSKAAEPALETRNTMGHLVHDAANYSTAPCKQAVDLTAQQDNEFAGTGEHPADHTGMPDLQTADAFVRGVDIILEAQQEFLSAMVNPSESAKTTIFGAAKK